MIDYSKSKIYTIRSYQTDKVYVGSTTQALSKRFEGHRKDYKCFLNNKGNYMTSFEILKYPDAYIELVKECPCENKEQLHKFEGEEIRKQDCVNKIVAGRTGKEYYEDNKDKVKEYNELHKDKRHAYDKKYREENREYDLQRKLEWYNNHKTKLTELVECECGSKVQRQVLSKHKKTDKHKSLLALLVLDT